MRRCVLLLLLWFVPALACAQSWPPASNPAHAVVKIVSHGGSGTVIATTSGRSWVLSCCHLFFMPGSSRIDSAALARELKIEAWPHPHLQGQRGRARVVAYDPRLDLSLLEVSLGPLYYVPVAPRGHRPGRNLLSCGYDRQTWPITMRPAHVIGIEGHQQVTAEPPVPGRSGGGLIDADARALIGVCHAYTMTGFGGSPHHGLYASHDSVLGFVEGHWHKAQRPAETPRPGLKDAMPPWGPKIDGWPEIAPGLRVPNRTGSQCVWSSLETCARYLEVTALYDLTSRHGRTAGPGDVAQVLGGRGVRYKQQAPGNRSTALIEEACRNGLPCVVGISGKHAVVCLGVDAAKARIIDNGGPHALQPRDWPRSDFDRRFDGWVVVLLRPMSAPPATAPQLPFGGRPDFVTPRPVKPCPGGT